MLSGDVKQWVVLSKKELSTDDVENNAYINVTWITRCFEMFAWDANELHEEVQEWVDDIKNGSNHALILNTKEILSIEKLGMVQIDSEAK
ncbi:hypothetical protein FC36_GL000195 [Ligilactobacillus equi DSM 15833 = JCM 10991]|nr:hypothetical protein FC36_GL000195 [Ligilactobacillus equi DSM 15833 = JCM 10991]